MSKDRSEQGGDDGGVSLFRRGAVAAVMVFEGGGGVLYFKERESVVKMVLVVFVSRFTRTIFVYILLKTNNNK